MDLEDTTPDYSFARRQLAALLHTATGALCVVTTPEGDVIAEAGDLGLGMRAADWLTTTAFHDPVHRAPSQTGQTVLEQVRATAAGTLAKIALLSPAGQEHIITLQRLEVPGTTDIVILARDAVIPNSSALPGGMNELLHDFANVLAIARSASMRLAESADPSEVSRRLADLTLALDRGEAVLQRAADGGQQIPPTPEPMDVMPVIRHACEIFERVLPEDVTLTVTGPETAIVTGTQKTDCEAAIIGMLGTARKSLVSQGPLAGRIDVNVRRTADQVELLVTSSMPASTMAIPPLGPEHISALQQPAAAADDTIHVSPQSNGVRLSLMLPTGADSQTGAAEAASVITQ